MISKNHNFNAELSQGTKLLHQGRPQEALPYLLKAHELEPNHIDAGINLSGAYILTKRFKKAVGILEPLAAQFPKNSMVWINLGAAYLGNPVLARIEDQDRAISAFEQALEINPVAYSVAYNLGLIYRDRREYEKAIYWFDQAVSHDPNDKDARRQVEKLKSV